MGIRRHLIGYLLLAAIGAIVWSCTELGEDTGPHPEDWDTGHIEKLQTINYDLTSCQACHGAELNGTDEVDGCSSDECHTASQGQSPLDAIYACDNCHGYIDSDPFADVVGNTSEDSLTVGTHTSHYTAAHSLTSNVSCGSCHVVPDSVFAAGHLEDSDSDVTFDSLATAGGTLFPMWDREAATCSDTYCHGNFVWEKDSSDIKFAYADSVIAGNNLTANWTQLYTGDDFCTTCHGYPPTGHVQNYVLCGLCHSSVVSDQDHRTIIDPAKHINGLKN